MGAAPVAASCERAGPAAPVVDVLDRLDMRLTRDPVDVGRVMAASYEMALQRALLAGEQPSVDDRYVASLVVDVIGAMVTDGAGFR